jgi:alpha-beta hydrolase superfamily lysophospholipase
VLVSVAIFLAISAAIYLLIGLGLTFSQSPQFTPGAEGETLDFTAALAEDLTDLPPTADFEARDTTRLAYRTYESAGNDKRIIILVHGSGWHGMQFHTMAKYLVENDLGTVIVPDLRGHGANPVRRGDVDHIGQLEEDLADLINYISKTLPDRQIIIGGHSSGGGLVVRFAGGEYGNLADAYMLMAPFLKYNAPTTRPNSGGWANAATRRIIGLTMLNAVGISAFNHLPVISFAMPQQVLDGPLGNTATVLYTHRLNTSFAPRDNFEADLAKMQQPFILLAGADDEAFYADRYETVISAQTQSGTYKILPGITHLGILTAPSVFQAMKDWLIELN